MSIEPTTLYRRLLDDGASPRLAWSSSDGEALELSGRVLANWTAKIANLLVEEADAEPGTRVLLDVPVHWRSLVWALGAWVAGATVVTDVAGADVDDDAPHHVDVVVTTRPEAWSGRADLVVAVTLPSFALRWTGAPLGEAIDGSADVAAQPDALGPVAPGELDAVALRFGGVEVTFAELAAGDGAGPEDSLGGVLLRAARALGGDGVVPLRG
ncbi:TIGR03089 family protein [Serinibacter arcticus]|uniref:TIGR03089 family protein n=1 Tax=Serinibacter arcticus TaxID=1655435 RepID=A0A4Z1E0A9_9MICO|nr:TIGR03089 family protein [Serinibacter arcticus]TGO04072.1 hypothetical protein SERN_2663 [Serinibacter arcticus]